MEMELIHSILADFGYSKTIDDRWKWVMESFPGETPKDIHDRLLMERNYYLSLATDQFIAVETSNIGTPYHELTMKLLNTSIFELRQKEFMILDYQITCGSITLVFEETENDTYFVIVAALYKIMVFFHDAYVESLKQVSKNRKRITYPKYPEECLPTAIFKEKVKYIVYAVREICKIFKEKLPLMVAVNAIGQDFCVAINKLLTLFIVNIDKVCKVV